MSLVFPAHWDVLPFSLAVKDATSEYSKLQKSEYLEQGRFPIVDQGQQKFGGYTDDESVVSLGGCPAVVFGDHTRIFKFIDEPFCLGADGAKVLEPKVELDKKFLFYYLSSLNIESAGYSRHFKFLKENVVPVPPLPEQKRIAAILDKADAIRRKRQQAIQLADDFLRALFLDMFGDPVTNPKEWELLPFSTVGTLDRGKSRHRPRNDPALLGGAHPLIQTGEVANSRGYIKEYSARYSDLGLAQSKKWDAGTLCITIAANIAKTGILTFPACFPDSVVGFIPNKHVTVEYVQHWLGFLQKNLEENAPQAAQKNINLEILRALLIPVPPKSEQEKFSSMVAGILAIEEKIASSSDALGNVFDALSQKAFSGHL